MKDFKMKIKNGFTLVELLIVIAVIGILATGAITIINPLAQLQKANDARRKSDLAQIQRSLELYYQDNGHYPITTSSTGFKINNVSWGDPWTPYMSTLPKDPSSPSKDYAYISDGQTYYLYASLDRGANDPQACSGGVCASISTNQKACVGDCNYGVSSPNASVSETASISVPTPAPTSTPTPVLKNSPCPPYGDVDLDGKVSGSDVQTLSNYLAGTTTLTDQQKHNGAVRLGDNNPTSGDRLLISQYVNGVRNTFPVCSITPTP